MKSRDQNDYPVQPVPFTEVTISDAFWGRRIKTNQTVTIPFAFKKCEETGRVDNFRKTGGDIENDRKHTNCPFDDSDVFKVLEGAAFALSVTRDPALEKYVDEVIDHIAGAQEDDGYLYTIRTMPAEKKHDWIGDNRWEKVKELSHELYNMGHMYEAATAYYQATGKRKLLDVSIKSADLIDSVYGPGKNEDAPGHQVIEMGLVKLYRATGEKRYLDLAKFFLDTRGPEDGEYSQAHVKTVEQDEAVGHAVRAGYMYAGMADVAAITGDADYLKAIDAIWSNVAAKKLYVTGGIGATHSGEAFGKNYELPNMSAYCETCASIANVYWNHRLFLLHGESKYIDVLERTLYNALISGVAMDGAEFFYPNPLMSIGQHKRSPWFGCSCCPTNVVRFMASIPGYVYAQRDNEIYVNLFTSSTADVRLDSGVVQISQETGYPWNGDIRIRLQQEQSTEFSLNVRIPGWARNQPVPSDLYTFLKENTEPPVLKVNDEPVEIQPEDGYVRITRVWKKGDTLTLSLPMPVRRVIAHEEVEEDRGMVAIQRGPIVYCAEWPDNGGHALQLFIPDDALLTSEYRSELLNGVQVITGEVLSLKRAEDEKTIEQESVTATLIPYYAWAHRGTGEMAVWMARELRSARPLPGPTIASTSEIKVSRDAGAAIALCDQMEPKHSNDHSMPYLHWWPNRGTQEWVEYHFKQTESVSSVDVYWYDDGPWGGCRIPASWQLLYSDNGEWKPVETQESFGIEKDAYTTVAFTTVTTEALRIEVQFQDEVSGGMLEWKVR